MENEITLENLVNRVYEKKDKYFRLGYVYLYNNFDVEDAVQNTIIKAYENIGGLKDKSKLDIWMTSIFVNECKGIIRKNKRKAFLHEQLEESIDSMGNLQNSIFIRELLSKVDKKSKDILILKYICSYSQEEIGEILNIPAGTVKSRIFRAIKKLGGVKDDM